MKHADIMLGIGGTATVFTTVNSLIGTITGLLTVTLLVLRVRREWKKRNTRIIIGPDGKPKTVYLQAAEAETSTT